MNYAVYSGIIGNSSRNGEDTYAGSIQYAIRPVICLPASVLGKKVGDVWNIE